MTFPPFTMGVVGCFWLVPVLAASAVEYRVDTISGQQMTGLLVAVGDAGVRLQSTDQLHELPLENVVRIAIANEPSEDASATPASVLATLADGTKLAGVTFTTQDQQSLIRAQSGTQYSVDTRAVRTVRLKPASKELDDQWQEYVGKTYESDALVIRKPGGSLDYFQGVVEQVDEDSVGFQFDGQSIDVPRERVEGIVFFSAAGSREVADPFCRVHTFDGSQVRGRQIELANGQTNDAQLIVTTSLGTPFKLPLQSVRSIDFSAGKIAYLSDVEPAAVHVQPHIESTISESVLALMYQPRRNESILGGALSLEFSEGEVARREYAKGLSLHSRTEMTWRLDGQFRRLKAVAGIDPRLHRQGLVRLEISGDGKPLFESEIAGNEPPQTIDLDVTGVDRLSILVDYGDHTDIADHLNLCELRVTK